MSAPRVSWLDVFTDRPFAGNPLAVVTEADELDERQMQRLAAELGISETAFVGDGGGRLRIFTPQTELPLAGHPVVGATLELVRTGVVADPGRHVFLTRAGEVPVDVADGVATMRQGELERLGELDPPGVAPMLGVAADALVGAVPICTTTGMAQALAQVRDRATLAAVRPDVAAIEAVEAADGLAAWCEHDGAVAQRFFAPRLGIPEDPATGSAAGAVGALRVHEGAEPGAIAVHQGEELGRPSTIQVSVAGSAGAPADVHVGGRAVVVLEATLAVPL